MVRSVVRIHPELLRMATSAQLSENLPDGRVVDVRWSGPTGSWTASIRGAGETETTGRSVQRVLRQVTGVPRGASPSWFRDLIRRVAGTETSEGWRFRCPCCEYLTLDDVPPGSFKICPVCRWEDDNLQYEDMDYRGGANRVSLWEARENFRRIGASDPARSARVRPPLSHEVPPEPR
jgi:hypothetical protein